MKQIKTSLLVFAAIAVLCTFANTAGLPGARIMNVPIESSGGTPKPSSAIFATYAESNEQLKHVCYLAESIRQFAGALRTAPVWVYLPDAFAERDQSLLERLSQTGAKVRASHTPPEAAWYYFAGKVFAAGEAEKDAEGKTAVLIWLDEDTIVLTQPSDLLLKDATALAYRPVMHNRSGSLASEPPDPFWSRIYEKLSLTEEQLFPMQTPADRQTIRAYFNAGLLAVRPEKGILRGWGEAFRVLYEDSVLAQMCRDNVTHRIFLHQTALVGAVLNRIGQDETVELSGNYNYPMFFQQQYGAVEEFDDLREVVTLRYDVYFRDPDPDWSSKLTATPKIIDWLKERLEE